VALAIAMDRLSQAGSGEKLSAPSPKADARVLSRHPYSFAGLHWLSPAFGWLVMPGLRTYPEAWQLSTGTSGPRSSPGSTSTIFDTLEAIKNAMLLNVLIPFKRF
jgi:glycine betaine/proline transport system permease protein